MEDLPVANDVPLCYHGEASFREPGRLNIEFFVGFEMVGEFSQEFVGHDAALVVRELHKYHSPQSHRSRSNFRQDLEAPRGNR